MTHSSTLVGTVSFHPVSPDLQRRGAMYWVEFLYGDLRVKCLKVWRAPNGGLRLTFPPLRIVDGDAAVGVFPFDDAARERLEKQVLAELDRQGMQR